MNSIRKDILHARTENRMQCVVKTAHRRCRHPHTFRLRTATYSVSPSLWSVRNNQNSGTANVRRYKNEHARFEVFTAVLLRIQVLPEVTLYRARVVSDVSKDHGALVPVKNHSPSDKASHPRNLNPQGTNKMRGVFSRSRPPFSGVRFGFRLKHQPSCRTFPRFSSVPPWNTLRWYIISISAWRLGLIMPWSRDHEYRYLPDFSPVFKYRYC
jgi:hypothetical protein